MYHSYLFRFHLYVCTLNQLRCGLNISFLFSSRSTSQSFLGYLFPVSCFTRFWSTFYVLILKINSHAHVTKSIIDLFYTLLLDDHVIGWMPMYGWVTAFVLNKTAGGFAVLTQFVRSKHRQLTAFKSIDAFNGNTKIN